MYNCTVNAKKLFHLTQHVHRNYGQNKYSAGNPVYVVMLGRDKINDKSF